MLCRKTILGREYRRSEEELHFLVGWSVKTLFEKWHLSRDFKEQVSFADI